jgi:phosphatidylglycerol:prolipoprotein diacylglycerol transferase
MAKRRRRAEFRGEAPGVLPTLFTIFGVPVPSYAVMMVLGYAVALWVLLRLTPPGGDARVDGGLDRTQVWDLFVVMVVASVLGAKIGHTLFEAPGHIAADGRTIESLPALLREDPWHWLRLGEGGYVWYGGMLGALGTAVFYFWRRPHLRAWTYSDLFAPAIMAGAVIGRLGCFLAGCCHGQPTELPWGVAFPRSGGPVHPTQLYDAAVALGIGALLYLRFPRRRFDGEIIALLLIGYPVLRATTELFRGDADRGFIGPLSTSQAISIPLLVVGVAIWIHRARTAPDPSADPGTATSG